MVWMESDTGKAGSCDMASISVLDQTHALGRMESHGLQHKPWTEQTIFDQLLSRNISMQRFHNDRNWNETELNKDNTKVVRWQRGTIYPQTVPPTEEFSCTRGPLAQLAGTIIFFHFWKLPGMSLQGPLEKTSAPWIEAKQDGRKLC